MKDNFWCHNLQINITVKLDEDTIFICLSVQRVIAHQIVSISNQESTSEATPRENGRNIWHEKLNLK